MTRTGQPVRLGDWCSPPPGAERIALSSSPTAARIASATATFTVHERSGLLLVGAPCARAQAPVVREPVVPRQLAGLHGRSPRCRVTAETRPTGACPRQLRRWWHGRAAGRDSRRTPPPHQPRPGTRDQVHEARREAGVRPAGAGWTSSSVMGRPAEWRKAASRSLPLTLASTWTGRGHVSSRPSSAALRESLGGPETGSPASAPGRSSARPDGAGRNTLSTTETTRTVTITPRLRSE